MIHIDHAGASGHLNPLSGQHQNRQRAAPTSPCSSSGPGENPGPDCGGRSLRDAAASGRLREADARGHGAGGDMAFIALPSLGLFGNNHLFTQDKNNLELADVILNCPGRTQNEGPAITTTAMTDSLHSSVPCDAKARSEVRSVLAMRNRIRSGWRRMPLIPFITSSALSTSGFERLFPPPPAWPPACGLKAATPPIGQAGWRGPPFVGDHQSLLRFCFAVPQPASQPPGNSGVGSRTLRRRQVSHPTDCHPRISEHNEMACLGLC
jgi:hypothetical protein